MSSKPLRVVELFAGVGGFRIALEGFPKHKNADFEVVWSNQFEPRSKVQHANIVYKNRWPDAKHSESDIEKIVHNIKGVTGNLGFVRLSELAQRLEITLRKTSEVDYNLYNELIIELQQVYAFIQVRNI